ncbi:hypothetical protein [Ignicoccus hospitalis]|nr:hypothetical protein [Ignicoccus hospitalis]HIH90591.1 hypothetical protein [Desulfurococcaceae archaeon]
MMFPYAFLSVILTQTLILEGTNTTVTLTTTPSLLYTLTVLCENATFVKSNVVLGPFTAETLSLPCEPRKVSLKAVLTYFLYHMDDKLKTITFTTVNVEEELVPRGTVTLNITGAELSLDNLVKARFEGELVVSFGYVPPPPVAAVGALAVRAVAKRLPSRAPRRSRSSRRPS